MSTNFLIASLYCDFSLLKHENIIKLLGKMQGMSDEYPSFVSQKPSNSLIENEFADMCVQGAKRIIKQDYVLVGIENSG